MTVTTTPPTLDEFLTEWGFLLTEPGAPDRDEITSIDAYWHWHEEDGGSESDLAALLRLTGGRWASLTSWCDYTGYGCQDGTDWRVFATRGEALTQGLDLEARRRLGLELPGEKIDAGEGA
jgi:hypothetical protein